MCTLKAFVFFFFWVGLATSSTSAANLPRSVTLTQNITVANAQYIEYVIPGVKPPVKLLFSHLSPEKPVSIDAPSVYMCAIENLARICRHHPHTSKLLKPEVLRYGAATIRMEGPKTPPGFTYNTACAGLRGLAEFMTQTNWWSECHVRVLMEDTEVGSVMVWNPEGDGGVSLESTA